MGADAERQFCKKSTGYLSLMQRVDMIIQG